MLFLLMFQVLSEVSWGGVRSGRNQGLEHGEDYLWSPIPSAELGADRGQGEDFYSPLIYFYKKANNLKTSPPLLYMFKYIFRSG